MQQNCPFPPCEAVGVLRAPLAAGDALVSIHVMVLEGRPAGTCPVVGLKRGMPPAELSAEIARRHDAWMQQQEAEVLRRVAGIELTEEGEVRATTEPAVREHILTPHPTQGSQWWVTGRERSSASMISAGEIGAAIQRINMLIAEGQELARAAAGKFSEAAVATMALQTESGGALAVNEIAVASQRCEEAFTIGHAAIDVNAAYRAGL